RRRACPPARAPGWRSGRGRCSCRSRSRRRATPGPGACAVGPRPPAYTRGRGRAKPRTLAAMLHLAGPSASDWGQWALAHIDEILLDHAHCEKKAASTALSMIFRYPEHPQLMIPMSELVREELEHFERVVALIRKRGGEFVRQEPSPYAARLMTAVRTPQPARLLDTLLC